MTLNMLDKGNQMYMMYDQKLQMTLKAFIKDTGLHEDIYCQFLVAVHNKDWKIKSRKVTVVVD